MRPRRGRIERESDEPIRFEVKPALQAAGTAFFLRETFDNAGGHLTDEMLYAVATSMFVGYGIPKGAMSMMPLFVGIAGDELWNEYQFSFTGEDFKLVHRGQQAQRELENVYQVDLSANCFTTEPEFEVTQSQERRLGY